MKMTNESRWAWVVGTMAILLAGVATGPELHPRAW